MKYFVLFLISFNLYAVSLQKDFEPGNPINSIDVNNNFNLIESHLSSLNTTINLDKASQGGLIEKNIFLNNYNNLANMNNGIQLNEQEISEYITSDYINQFFLDLENLIVNKLSSKEIQEISLDSSPAQGSYDLNYDNNSITISYNDSLLDIENKIKTLTNDNDLYLAGDSDNYIINFGKFGDKDLVIISNNSLEELLFVDGQRDPSTGDYYNGKNGDYRVRQVDYLRYSSGGRETQWRWPGVSIGTDLYYRNSKTVGSFTYYRGGLKYTHNSWDRMYGIYRIANEDVFESVVITPTVIQNGQ